MSNFIAMVREWFGNTLVAKGNRILDNRSEGTGDAKKQIVFLLHGSNRILLLR